MIDDQTFIEVKQHPQAGPETPHTMCEKFEDFLKNSIFDYFLTFCHGGPPPWLLITGGSRENFQKTELCPTKHYQNLPFGTGGGVSILITKSFR